MNDKKTNKDKGRIPSYPVIIFLVIITLIIVFYMTMWHPGKTYDPQRYYRDCGNFCAIAFPTLSFPYTQEVLDTIHRQDGVYVHLGSYRKAITYDSAFVHNHLPCVVAYAKSLEPTISAIVGESVFLTPADHPTTIAILRYTGDGDGIDWHYDVNHYSGRFLTLIIPILTLGTGRFQYRDGEGMMHEVSPDQSVLFEGDYVFHRASQNRGGERIVLSIQYSTSGGKSTIMGSIGRWIKDRAFVFGTQNVQ